MKSRRLAAHRVIGSPRKRNSGITFRRARSLAFASACALALTVCGREPTGPGVDVASGFARLVMEPGFAPAAGPLFQASGATIDNVHLVLRAADGTVVLDTVVTFAPGQNEVSITANIPVRGES